MQIQTRKGKATQELRRRHPPENDSLSRAIRAQEWKLKTLERNYAGKEKGLDIEIALDMNDLARRR